MRMAKEWLRNVVRLTVLPWVGTCLVLALLSPASSVVQPCPDKCICLSDKKVLCSGVGLEAVPPDIPPPVEELSFSGNSLVTLKKDMFEPWKELRVLNLDSNEITTLDPFVFKGMSSLKEISIQKNPLPELTQFTLAGIENVSQINLSNNKIQVIHEYVFAGTRNIGMLLLLHNPLIRIKARAFSGLRMIQFLYLPSWIKVIESDAFYDVEGVGLLKLASLDLHSLRKHTFRELRNVTQISLQDSNIGILRKKAFEGLRNVGELRFLNNKVDAVESLQVTSAENVDKIIVKGNHFLQVRQPGPFQLEGCVLTVVAENYVPCSCQLLWVLESPVVAQQENFLQHNYCVSPYSLHGRFLSTVNVSSFESCTTPQELQLPNSKTPSSSPPPPLSPASWPRVSSASFVLLWCASACLSL